jgi:RHS repeat-associated protein
MLLAHEVASGPTPQVFWTLGDHQNSVRDYVAYDGTSVVNHVSFNAFGERVGETNPAAVDALFGFTGRPTDESTGLNNHLNRWYDPVLHQWLSEDPLGLRPDENPRRYVGNDPVNFVDPDGTDRIEVHMELGDNNELVPSVYWCNGPRKLGARLRCKLPGRSHQFRGVYQDGQATDTEALRVGVQSAGGDGGGARRQDAEPTRQRVQRPCELDQPMEAASADERAAGL